MQRLLLLSTLLLLLLGGCYDQHSAPPMTEVTLKVNFDIADLRRLCSDGCQTITKEYTCVGRVTSSDREGNFYRTMFIEDNSGGVAIRVGLYDLASQYPIGTQIALHLQNSAAMLIDGCVVVGLPPRSYDSEPREFESQEIINRYITRGTSVEAVEPKLYDISELNSSLCGSLIKVVGLRCAPLSDEEEAPTMEGYRRFTDNNGEAVFSFVSPYASFATMKTPYEDIFLCGILYYESVGMGIGKQFVIKPRSKNDIATSDSFFH